MKKIFFFLVPVFILVSCSCNNSEKKPDDNTPPIATAASMSYQVLNVYPHDITCFTEGLEWHDSTLYESRGLYGESKLVRVSLKDGKDIKKVDLDKKYFGEGISILNGKLYQLTYKESKCFVYDPQTFKKTGEFTYQGQGWGMTNNGQQLIMDTGSNELFFIDPTTFTVVSKIAVL